jgi:zeta-carotene isomerase
LKKQKISSWIYFTAILGVVLFILNVVWINNETGFGKAFVDAVSSLSDSHEVMCMLLSPTVSELIPISSFLLL